jgi:hypothetical protein
MSVERAADGTSLIDVLDRVLDKGIIIDTWMRRSLVGIDVLTVEARAVVASIQAYLKYSERVGEVMEVSRAAMTFVSIASSQSALRRDGDDDDRGPDEPGGARALLDYPLKPRARHSSSRERGPAPTVQLIPLRVPQICHG